MPPRGEIDENCAMNLNHHIDLKSSNTLALSGYAADYLKVRTISQLRELPSNLRQRFVLGGGSNLVLTGDFDGLILHMAIPGKRLLSEDDDAFYVEAGAGENWHDFVQWTLAQGWPGLENLSLIPGTVGAAPIQNIGAYGLEVGELLAQVTAWDFEKKSFFTVDRRNCRFAYRDSLFKQEGWHLNGRIAITSVTFRLPKRWQPNLGYADIAQELANRGITTPTPQAIAAAIVAVRQRKLPDPAVIPNAGSFFHNPVVEAAQADALAAAHPGLPRYPQADGRIKLAAGWLIEQAGWKGKDLGPVGMYEKRALVLVNRGGATGDDVQRTMSAMRQAVFEQFGIVLHPEPVFL